MTYLIFNDHGGRYGDEANLEEHLKMCARFSTTPDFWSSEETILDAVWSAESAPFEDAVIVNANTYEVVE